MGRYTLQASNYSNNMDQLKGKLREVITQLNAIKGKLPVTSRDCLSGYVQQLNREIEEQINEINAKCGQSAGDIMNKAKAIEAEEEAREAELLRKQREENEKLIDKSLNNNGITSDVVVAKKNMFDPLIKK